MKYSAAAATDIGRLRSLNEDCFFINESEEFPYIIVADGMGGHQAGEIASRMLVDIVYNRLRQSLKPGLDYVEAGEALRRSFFAANNIIYTYSKNHYKVMGMGTTASLAMIYQDRIITAHVGDSRIYAVDDDICQITRDHSYVQELVKRGEITQEQAQKHPKKNYITRAMGAEETVKVDIGIRPYNGEIILLCSDGLTNMVDERRIFKTVSGSAGLQDKVQKLIDLANKAGGRDNITAALLEREI